MKTITYYKVRVEGIQISSSYIMLNATFENLEEAIQYIKKGWNEYSKEYLKRCERKIISEYERINTNGYLHQITIKQGTGITQIITLAIDKKNLYLR